MVGPGLVIDTNKYYVVFLDSLGLWGTSKPSEGLGRTGEDTHQVRPRVGASRHLFTRNRRSLEHR